MTRRFLEGLILLAAIAGAHGQTTVAGFTPGSFRVTETGAASYSISLRVPPGIAGMEPKLALAYNSQGGNGLLGVGWNLEGLSAVTRCPKTMAQDSARGGVNFDSNDRFCMDGQRLIAISGTYGADGTEYRTERESFTKVISYGAAGNGPAWFKAWTKSGQILEYGNTTDSKVEAQGKTSVRAWALNKVSDTKANAMALTYEEDSTNGDFRPYRICYAKNTDPCTSPVNRVEFVYQTRSDVTALYVAGSVMKTMQRLQYVRTYASTSTLTAEYRLSYDTGGAMSRSRLSSVQECDGAGNCISPVAVSWQSGSSGFGTVSSTHGLDFGNPSSWATITGDFNGDGRTDFARLGATNFYVFLSDGDGTFTWSVQNYPGLDFGYNLSAWVPITGDFNGDGKTDYIRLGGTDYYVFLSNGDGTFSTTARTPGLDFGNPSSWKTITGDFNGDGKTDFARLGGTSYYVFLSNGDSQFTWSWANYPGLDFGSGSNTWLPITGDFNGDGKTDYIRLGGTDYYVFLSDGDGTFSTYARTPGLDFGNPSSWATITGDFNGDGRTDFARLGATHTYVFMSNGESNFNWTAHVHGYDFGNSLSTWVPVTGDLNGDGKTDYVRLGATEYYVFRSNGDGSFSGNYVVPGLDFGNPSSWVPITGDFNGDGLSDFARLGGTDLYTFKPNGAVPDLLTSVTNSLGAQTSVSYKSLVDSSVYTKGSAATYPQVTLQVPFYVVSTATVSNGIGGTVATGFQYGGLKLDLQGRGLLGFGWKEETNQSTSVKLRAEMRQDWPYVGLSSQAKRTTSGGAVLSQTDNTFSCINPASGAACSVAAGNRYFPFASQTVEAGNDLNAAALPTVTTSYTYDSYGNASSVAVSTGDGYGKVTTNTFTNDTTNWFLGRLTRSTVQSTTP